jgi:hypothetical protein
VRHIAQRVNEWFSGARYRARRRKSAWNLILVPFAFISGIATWYGLFRVVWAFHLAFYPEHRLQDFWREGISFASFVPSFLMVFGLAPGAICAGFVLANCAAWFIPPARRALDLEAVGYPGAGFRDANSTLLKIGAWSLCAGVLIAMAAAYTLGSLK